MRNKGKFSKWVWLVLVVAFAAIAGGGCLGSSSGGGDGSNNGGSDESNVTEIDVSEHPLAAHLREVYDQMPEGTLFLSEKLRGADLAAMKDRLMAAYDDGKIIGMYAPTQERIEKLHEALGIRIFQKRATSGISADPDEDDPSVFYLIKQHEGIIFQHIMRFWDEKNSGSRVDVKYPAKAISFDYETDDAGNLTNITATSYDLDPNDIVDRVKGDREQRFPQIAKDIAAWNDFVSERAAKIKADSVSARETLSAAAGFNQLEKLMAATDWHVTDYPPMVKQNTEFQGGVNQYQLQDRAQENRYWFDCYYMFPAITITATMYSAHSFDDGNDYFLVQTNGRMNNESNYHHWFWQTDKFLWDPIGFDFLQNVTLRYDTKVSLRMRDRSKFSLDSYGPLNTNYEGSTTTHVGLTLGSDIGINPGIGSDGKKLEGSLGLSAAIEMGKDETFPTQDYWIEDHTVEKDPHATYRFEEPKKGKRHNYYQDIQDVPEKNAQRSAFSTKEVWVWFAPHTAFGDGNEFAFDWHYEYDNLLIHEEQHALGIIPTDWLDSTMARKSYSATWKNDYVVPLPVPPTLAVSDLQMLVNYNGRTAGNKPLEFSLYSEGGWKLSLDADWVDIISDDLSGDEKVVGKRILVQVDPNHDRDQRKAHVIVTGPNDPNGLPQQFNIEITQEGRR